MSTQNRKNRSALGAASHAHSAARFETTATPMTNDTPSSVIVMRSDKRAIGDAS